MLNILKSRNIDVSGTLANNYLGKIFNYLDNTIKDNNYSPWTFSPLEVKMHLAAIITKLSGIHNEHAQGCDDEQPSKEDSISFTPGDTALTVNASDYSHASTLNFMASDPGNDNQLNRDENYTNGENNNDLNLTINHLSDAQIVTAYDGGTARIIAADDAKLAQVSTNFAVDGAEANEALTLSLVGSNLTMLELSGNGRIAVDAASAESVPFTIIDASELSGGLSYSASADVQEVINLADVSNGEPTPQPPLYGSVKLEPIGHDVLDFSGDASTYGLDGDGIDTVYGFDTDDDTLIVNGEAITAQYSLDLGTILNGTETLEEAFQAASEANNGDDYLPFVFGESDDFDLYLYKDLGTDGLDSDDFALHLTNLVGEAGLLGMKDNRDFIPSGDNGFNNPNQFSSFNTVDVDSDIVNGTEYAPDNFVFDTEDLVFDSRSPDAAPSITIANFEPNYDTLDFSALSEVQSAYPFGDPVRTVVGVTNDDGEYATVFLAGIHKFSLNLEDNFIFAS